MARGVYRGGRTAIGAMLNINLKKLKAIKKKQRIIPGRDSERAKDYNRKADRAMDVYKTQMRYAANVDDKAADYLHKGC